MHNYLTLSTTRVFQLGAAMALLVACAEGAAGDLSSGGAPGTGGAAAASSGGMGTGGTAGTTSGTSGSGGSTGGSASGTGGSSGGAGGSTGGSGGTGGLTGGTSGTGGSVMTGGAGTGGSTSAGGSSGSLGVGGGAGTTGGSMNGGTGAGGRFGGGAGRVGAGGSSSGGMAGTGTSGTAGTGTSGSAGTGTVTPPGGANSVAYIGCSMAYNIGTGYKRVGGKVMWNSDSYQTSAMVVQNWTDSNSSSWQLFDQKMSSIGGKDTVKAIMIQICIFSSRATDAELRSMVASARNHVNAGTHIYMVGQPQYEAGHECSLAGTGGAKWTDDQAKALAADSSVNENMTYLGKFIIDSTKGEVSSDSCHATTSGEDALGKEAMVFFGG